MQGFNLRTSAIAKTAFKALKVLVTPIARFAVHFGIPSAAAIDALKAAYVQAATEQYRRKGRAPTDTEIHVVTGIRRQSIPAIRQNDDDELFELGTLSKVMGVWMTRYLDGNKRPMELPFRAVGAPSFTSLVKGGGQGAAGPGRAQYLCRGRQR